MRLVIGTKFRPSLRTDFSESVSGRFSGIVITVLWLCNVVSSVICGPINCWSFRVLVWCKWSNSPDFGKFGAAMKNFPKSVQQFPKTCPKSKIKICPAILVQSIRAKIQQLNSGLFDHLHQTKTLKLQQLIGPQITDDTTLHSQNTVITIPENLPLTDSEKSVLSEGLNFVPITKRTNEFTIKQDVEKFLRRVQLKAFFHDKEDDSDTSDKDIFETLFRFFHQKMPSRHSQT